MLNNGKFLPSHISLMAPQDIYLYYPTPNLLFQFPIRAVTYLLSYLQRNNIQVHLQKKTNSDIILVNSLVPGLIGSDFFYWSPHSN